MRSVQFDNKKVTGLTHALVNIYVSRMDEDAVVLSLERGIVVTDVSAAGVSSIRDLAMVGLTRLGPRMSIDAGGPKDKLLLVSLLDAVLVYMEQNSAMIYPNVYVPIGARHQDYAPFNVLLNIANGIHPTRAFQMLNGRSIENSVLHNHPTSNDPGGLECKGLPHVIPEYEMSRVYMFSPHGGTIPLRPALTTVKCKGLTIAFSYAFTQGPSYSAMTKALYKLDGEALGVSPSVTVTVIDDAPTSRYHTNLSGTLNPYLSEFHADKDRLRLTFGTQGVGNSLYLNVYSIPALRMDLVTNYRQEYDGTVFKYPNIPKFIVALSDYVRGVLGGQRRKGTVTTDVWGRIAALAFNPPSILGPEGTDENGLTWTARFREAQGPYAVMLFALGILYFICMMGTNYIGVDLKDTHGDWILLSALRMESGINTMNLDWCKRNVGFLLYLYENSPNVAHLAVENVNLHLALGIAKDDLGIVPSPLPL
jgi:hypothetical protein